MRSGKQTLGEIERQVQADIRANGCEILEGALQTMGNGLEESHRPCACGGMKRCVADRSKTVRTLMGPVRISRAYYHCGRCASGEFPLDAALGVEGTSLSPAAQEAAAWADAEMAYGRAAAFLSRVLGPDLSKDTHQTLSGELGEAAQAGEEERDRAAWSRLGPAEQFYAAVDGLKVNTDEGWKEPKLCAIFRAKRGRGGKPVRLLTRYAGHLEEAEAFGERVWGMAEALGVGKARTTVVLGDGAAWIWNLAEFHFPEAVQIVDFYHAVERLSEVATAVWGEGAARARAWLRWRRKALRNGNVGAVLRHLQALPAKGKETRDLVRRAVGYFRENRSRMRYGAFRKAGLFIGSGVVEAACKSIVAQRFKQSGMRWSREGFLRLLHLRLCILNDDWDAFARSRFPRVVNLPAAYF